MISCRDVNNLQMDGMELVAGAAGLDRIVSWTYLVQTKPYKDHMNPGNFALLVVDYKRFSMDEAYDAMVELNELGISGFAISVVEDREETPQRMKDKADELKLPLFYIRWEGATFVDIAQSVGELLLETSVDNKRTGDYLYNLLFGYEVNDKYIKKISAQFGLTFDRPYRVGIIVIDRKIRSESGAGRAHIYILYRLPEPRGYPYEENAYVYEVFKTNLCFFLRRQRIWRQSIRLKGYLGLRQSCTICRIHHSTCILGAAYRKPADFGKSYQEAKNLIPKKDILPNPTNKKVISASSMGIYKYMFNSGNQQEIMDYCNEKLKRLEMYDNANGSFLIDTLLNYYMCGFNVPKNGTDDVRSS